MAADPKRQAFLQFFFGGLLPVIAFTVIEEIYGTIAGIVAGMVFSAGEIAWEWWRTKRVSGLTLGISLLILILGVVSLLAKEGIWFKLQPALMEAGFCIFLIGSYLLGKPFLLLAVEKQGTVLPPALRACMPALTVRLGVFMGAHAVLATWAAIHWSTTAWALLKGIGFTLSFFVYMAAEFYFLRQRVRAAMPTTGSVSPPKT